MEDNKIYYAIGKSSFCVILVVLMIIFFNILSINAQEIDQNDAPELIEGYVTAYNGPTDTTYIGTKCRQGICGGCEDYLGKTIILYQRLPGNKIGKIIGIYECQDKGTGTKSFQEGKLIDVWQPKDQIQEFIDMTYEDGCQGKVFIQVIDGKG